MKCPTCHHHNPTDSQYCERCGHRFGHAEHSPSSIVRELDDIVFTPSKQGSGWGRILLGVFIGFVIVFLAILGLAMVGSRGSTANTTTNTTNVDTSAPTEPAATPTTFPIEYLSFSNRDMKWIGSELYFAGTLKNDYTASAKNVSVRLDLYNDQAMTDLFDTRYVTILGAPGLGAFSFQLQVYAYPQTRFWYTSQIVGAEYNK